jgi:hypothetical protein
MNFINASTKQRQDSRWMLARDGVAAEINIRAGNPGADGIHTHDARHLLDDAVRRFIQTTGDNVLTTAELSAGKVGTSIGAWQNAILSGDPHSANVMHVQLDGYNNTGSVFGVRYASDGDFVC